MSDSTITPIMQARESAYHAFHSGALRTARRILRRALQAHPGDAESLKMLGIVEQRLGLHADAVVRFRAAATALPGDAAIQTGLGISLSELGDTNGAVRAFRAACEFSPRAPSAWSNLGELLTRLSRASEAIGPLDKALSLDPENNSARLTLARACAMLGRGDAAAAQFREVLSRAPGNVEAWFGLSYLNTQYLDATDVVPLQRCLVADSLTEFDREKLLFALAKAMEQAGDYDGAFNIFRAANELGARRVTWNAHMEHTRVLATWSAFTNQVVSSADSTLGYGMIFIASLPRSGSTLVEQILAAHPNVTGGNELRYLSKVLDRESHKRNLSFPRWVERCTAADWERLGREYLAMATQQRRAAPFLTDKSLQNWLLIGASLAMLPAARVVLVSRDPVETCLACYRQCLSSESGFACDLDAAAEHYTDFFAMTQFWLAKYAGRVFDLKYEALQVDPDHVIAALQDFCGLPFSEHCLHFYDSDRSVASLPSAVLVRAPIRHNTSRAHLYGHKLDALRAALRDVSVRYARGGT